MNRNFRLILFLLLLPTIIAALYLDTRLRLSTSGHALVQIGMLCAAFWLAWRWVVYDEMSNLREFHRTESTRYHYRTAASFGDAETFQNELIDQRRSGTVKPATRRMASMLTKANQAMNLPVSPARVVHALLSVGVVFALTVVMLLIGSKMLGEGVIAILYLLPIGWCTVRWGQIAGVGAALTAAMAFDYLFIPPYNTFNIGSLEGWLLLILFFATAILVVGRIQRILTEERERERKATFLYEMVAAIANQATREGIARAIASQIQQSFLAEGVQVNLTGEWGYLPYTARAAIRPASLSNTKPDRTLAIISGPALIGEIDIWKATIPIPPQDDPMLQTMLNQTAAAIERVRVIEGKPPYPKQKPSFPEGDSLQTSQS